MPSLDHALELKRAGALDAAVIALEEFLSQAPDHAVALAHLGDVQLRRGRGDQAAAALDRAEAAGGMTAFTARIRGELFAKAHRWADAATAYQNAVALGDRGTWSLVQLARCRLRLKDIEGARGAAATAAERAPEDAEPLVMLGDIAAHEQRLDEAERLYEQAVERDRGNEWAYAKLVEARLVQMEPDKREREIKVLLKTTGGSNKHLFAVLARLRTDQGDPAGAATTWGDRASRTGDSYARKQQGFALSKAGKLDEAAAVLGPCLLADPDDMYVFRSYVSVQRRRGALEELRRTLEDALPKANSRRGLYFGELRRLPAP